MAANGEIFRTVIKYETASASQGQTVHHHQLSGAGFSDQDVLDALEDWADNDWGAAWALLGGNDVELTEIEVDVVNPDGTVNRNIGSVSINKSGASLTSTSAAAVAGFMEADTGFAKRRGRKYAPFIGDNKVSSGVLSSVALNELTALFAEWVADIIVLVTGTLIAGILSRVDDTFYAFNGAGTTTNVPAYQRRRKPGVGI